MRKQKIEQVVKTIDEIVEETIACNSCGKSISQTQLGFESDHFHNVNLHFGYGSNYDMEHWSFDICEDCITSYIKTFKHVPSGFQLDQQFLIIEDESEEHQKLFEDWLETDEWDELRYKSHDEIIELKGIYSSDYIDTLIKERFPNKATVKEEL